MLIDTRMLHSTTAINTTNSSIADSVICRVISSEQYALKWPVWRSVHHVVAASVNT
jgi:hypothetical protein